MADSTSNLSECFFSHSSRIDGAERSLLQLITELIRDHRVNCTVVLPGDGPLKERLEQIGASTVSINYSWWCDQRLLGAEDLKARLNNGLEELLGPFNQELARINPDVIVTNTIVIPWGAITASLLRKPHVWHLREFGDYDFKFVLPFQEILKIVTDSSNLILTNSNALKGGLFGETSDSNIVTVYNRIEIPTGVLSQEDRQNYFTMPNATKLIVTGWIAKPKGQEDAILAVKELVQRKRKVELIVMGAGNGYLKELEKMVSDENLKDHVKFLEFRDNPYPAVNQADIVLVCSKIEAFGRVTVEAMLLKKPVIGTSVGGTTELIKEGYNGLLYQCGDYRQLADRIEYLMDHEQKIKEFGENGFVFAQKSFTREGYGGKVYELLDGLKNGVNPLSSNYFDFLKESMLALYAKRHAQQQGLMREVAQKEEETSQLQATVQARSQEFAEKEEEVARLQATVQARSQEFAEKEEEVVQLQDVLATLRHEIVQQQLTMRAQRQALALKEAQAALVQATVEAQQQVLSQKDEERGQLQATVEALKQEIVSVKDTLGWMMGDRYRRAKDKSRLLSIVNSAVLLPIKRRIKRQPSVASKTD